MKDSILQMENSDQMTQLLKYMKNSSRQSARGFSAKQRSDYFPKFKHLNDDKKLYSQRKRMSASQLKFKKNNTFLSKVGKERKWNDRFSVASSKNNMRVYSDYKEYFDRPIDYDVRGYNFTLRPLPMMVYEDDKGNPDIYHPRFDDRKKKQLAKRLSNDRSKTSRGKSKEVKAIRN